MIVLGIESSCDETAVGIVEISDDQQCCLLANQVATSLDLHKLYGGVVPEIAARSHIESIMPVVDEALKQAFGKQEDLGSQSLDLRGSATAAASRLQAPRSKIQSDPWDKIDAIAVTYGGGLGGSLLVGVMTARTLAIVKNKPLYAVNHVIGHVYANFITDIKDPGSESLELGQAASDALSLLQDQSSQIFLRTVRLADKEYALPSSAPQFPMLALIVSGKHSQLALFKDHFDYDLLGWTRDDAVGEAFDKVAKLLGLPYPGGPSVAEAAKKGNPCAYAFPKPQVHVQNESLDLLRAKNAAVNDNAQEGQKDKKLPHYDFSFSGIKTSVLRTAQNVIGEDFTFPSFKIAERLSEQQKCDIAASFQRVATEILADKTVEACKEFRPRTLVLAGGVAASSELRRQLETALSPGMGSQAAPLVFQYPDIKLCTDNGAMIATLGCFSALLGQPTADPYALEIAPNLTM